jgi:hypothetical protein
VALAHKGLAEHQPELRPVGRFVEVETPRPWKKQKNSTANPLQNSSKETRQLIPYIRAYLCFWSRPESPIHGKLSGDFRCDAS